jgi:RNA polymerase sigma-54 factor
MMSQQIGLNISQRLGLSPQHVLFSTLLQMPMMALEQRIKLEMEQNPMLEEDLEIEMEDEMEERQDESETEESSEDEEEPEEVDDDIDWEDSLEEDDDEYSSFEKKAPEEEALDMPDPAPVTLTDKLIEQLHETELIDAELEAGEFVIGNIDPDGYLSCPIEQIAQSFMGDVALVEKVLRVIHTFEPAGIAARDLRECLLIQLLQLDIRDWIAEKLIADYFDDFKNKRFERLARVLDVDLEDIKDALETISKLNPKPGEGDINPSENFVIPEVIVEKVGDEFVVTLNDGTVPQLRISNAYRKMLTDGKRVPKETRQFIKQKIESARWLINSIQQRRMTILNVMQEIVARQRPFFELGPGNIKPMILKDIADIVQMDISTISRVTNGKYAQTDYGVFELKYFFSERMTTSAGEEISTLNIKSRLREIIEGEDPKKPLTDDRLVKILTSDGIPIARRTVAKYREQMRIPVARLRRQI